MKKINEDKWEKGFDKWWNDRYGGIRDINLQLGSLYFVIKDIAQTAWIYSRGFVPPTMLEMKGILKNTDAKLDDSWK